MDTNATHALIDNTNVHLIVSALAWPVTVLICLAVILFLFRDQIIDLLRRLRELIFGKISVKLDALPNDGNSVTSVPPADAPYTQRVSKDKPANCFWLGSDFK